MEGEMRARREAKDEELREACARVDDWLRDFLANGPAVRDRIFEESEAAGFPIHPSPNHRGASLFDTRQRLGVLGLEKLDGERTPFWCLPDVPFDEQTFRIYQGESRRSRQMTGAMR